LLAQHRNRSPEAFFLKKPDYNLQQPGIPTLAIVGRPNVGKSTLFNRIIGSRRAIVGDEPGITRDRLYGETEWRGFRLRVIDTGGIIPDDHELIPSEILKQAKTALEEAQAVVLVVDGRSELAAPDIDLARMLQRSGTNLFLAVNKIDTPKMQPAAENFRRLGIKNLFPVSAEHGVGLDDLLDAVLESLPKPVQPDTSVAQASPPVPDELDETQPQSPELRDTELHDSKLQTPELRDPELRNKDPRETNVAIIGRPNVGKSTLLNRLTGSSRAIVSPIPGTTRDAVDELVERDGQRLRFIDTAGIRRKGKTKLMAEKLSVVMARKHLEAADVALMVVDAAEGVTATDATIAGYAHESGRSLIVIVNKWDLLTTKRTDGRPPADRDVFEQQSRDVLKFLSYAPILFVSATEGSGTDKIFSTLEKVAAERRKRISTGEMNRFLKHVDFERASVPSSRRIRILYMTQAAVAPPTFILFTDRDVKLHFSYQRFLENQIRKSFGFIGTPIWIKNRARE